MNASSTRRSAVTESPTPNPGTVKLAAVALGAYVLGRMKKGRMAISLAMWATGNRMDPKELLRQGVLNLANSAEGKQVLSQLRGPVLEAGRRAASATFENQANALAKALESRTSALAEGAGKAGGKAAETAGKTAGTAGETAEDAGGKATSAVSGVT